MVKVVYRQVCLIHIMQLSRKRGSMKQGLDDFGTQTYRENKYNRQDTQPLGPGCIIRLYYT